MPSGEKFLLAGLGIIAVMKEKAQKQINVLIQKCGISKVYKSTVLNMCHSGSVFFCFLTGCVIKNTIQPINTHSLKKSRQSFQNWERHL